jgi:segregation and condensation protein B
MSDQGQDLRLLEALLFASAQPLDDVVLASRLPEGADVASLLAELVETYRNRGVTLEKVAGGWTFRTAADLAPRLMLERLVSRKLSRAAIETLAIIAYHQPVTRTEIEEIRGVVVNRGILDTLMESGWIRPKGHKQTPGRPATWVTTPEFLVHFGLDGLADLPGIDELKAAGLLDPRPAASLTDMVADSAPAESEDEAEDDGDDDADDDRGDEVEALASDAETDPPAST